VYEVMVRPARARGGTFARGTGIWYADGLTLRTLLSIAYSVPLKQIEGPKELLGKLFDLRIALPQGAGGEAEIMREALERAFRLKLRRERREGLEFLMVEAAALPVPTGLQL
jgi:uncharacterized protein (TIGR03435 family)